MNTKNFTDQELQVIKVALEFLRNAKQQSLTPVEKGGLPFAKVNEYDILSVPHTLMYTITALSKLTGQPIAHFANNPNNPSPEEKEENGTHRSVETHGASASSQDPRTSA